MGKLIFISLFCMFFSHVGLAMNDENAEKSNYMIYTNPESSVYKRVNSQIKNPFPEKKHESTIDKDFILGKDAFRVQKYKESFNYLSRAADNGHHRAEHIIGILYEFGLLGKVDLDEAEKYYLLSGKHGNKHAEDSIRRVYSKQSWW